MDFLTFLLLIYSIVVFTSFYAFGMNSWYRRSTKLPPGPFPLPIIGNILQLGQNPHLSLTKLSKIYGPLMYLKIGSIKTIVVSSPEMAKEILQKHDQVCSGRTIPYTMEALNHHEFSVAWLPVENKWRTFRKICKEHMFTVHKLEATGGLRLEKVQQLRNYVEECCRRGRVVNIAEVTYVTTLNLISNTLFSMDFANFHLDSDQEIRETIEDLIMVTGTPNIADNFPILKLFDPKGLKRKTAVVYRKVFAIIDEIISKRLQSRGTSSNSPRENDLLDVLLDLNEEDDSDLSLDDIKHFLLDLLPAGAHTTSDSAQWVMAELLHNPEKLSKAKNELRTVIGENKQVEESDIPKLSYLSAVIKESFRRHPGGPFLLPHKAEADVEINGYLVPKDARIFVNIWAIGRDPRIWSNPDSFEPERFLSSKIDYKGQHFELLPFSAGRRICPGIPLAHLILHIMVACLIHNFDWKLEGGIKPEELDMSEEFGLLLHKKVPLKAIPVRQ